MKIQLTTSYHPQPDLIKKAMRLAAELNIPFFSRSSMSMKEYWANNALLLILEEKRLVLANKEKKLSFHPNMAKLRILNLQQGKPDHLLKALNLIPGDTLLDCTAGLCGDALTAAWFLQSAVTAWEADKLIYAVTQYGLANYEEKAPDLKVAMHRINLHNKDYVNCLPELPEESFSVIYFDPMFDHSVKGSSTMESLRCFARTEPLTPELLNQALRAAKKRVVVKVRAGSRLLQELNCPEVRGGRYSRIAYGIWRKGF